MGPHPFPWMVREFQRVVGDEARAQCRELLDGDDPDVVVACVGGGSNAIGTFTGFLDTDARLVGVEAGGLGLESGHHGAAVSRGVPGVVHGMRSLFLQDEYGQVLEATSISAGLDYPGRRSRARDARGDRAGPSTTPRPTRRRSPASSCSRRPRASCPRSSRRTRSAGSPARPGTRCPTGSTVLVTLSGRGDKDAAQVAGDARRARVNVSSRTCAAAATRGGRKLLVPYVTGGSGASGATSCARSSTPAPTRSRSGSRSPIRSWTAARSRRRASARSISARRRSA